MADKGKGVGVVGEAGSWDRRTFLGGSAALVAAALTTGEAAGQTITDAEKAQKDRSASDAGPENALLREANPYTFVPPVTDHGEVRTFWNSFSTSHRRIQEGGWSRQVTVADFPLSKDIAGVNMRLTAGGIRELHWHEAGEWSIMLSGNARITAIDDEGKSFVKDIVKNDLWYFPAGTPHSIQGLQPDGCEFMLVFDEGTFSEGNTTLISDWTRHTPKEVLAKNWGVPEAALESVYKVPDEGHYIFQAAIPPPVEQDVRAAAEAVGHSTVAFDFPMHAMAPTIKTRGGEIRIVDAKNFPVMNLTMPTNTLAMAHVTVKPGGMRELHWHQNADEWQYYIQGRARMTVFFNGSKARTADFNAGDVGYIPKTFGHYIENTGDTDLVFIEMFKSNRYVDLSLSQWVRSSPPELVIQHLGISEATLRAIPQGKPGIMPL